MQKKIVAAICAAALALAMPVAAFAANNAGFDGVKNGSIITITGDKDVDGDNAKLSNLVMTANSSWVWAADVAATSATASNYVAYTNDVMKQSFTVDPIYRTSTDYAGNLGDKDQMKAGKVSLSFDVTFDAKKCAQLPTTIDQDNLYARGYIQHGDGGVETVAPALGTTVHFDTNRCSTFTAVLGNGPLSYGQPVGQNTTDDLTNAAKNGNTSPKTGELA